MQVSLPLTDGVDLLKTCSFFTAAEMLHLVIRQTRFPYTSYHPGCNPQTIYDHCDFWKSQCTILAVLVHVNIFILPLNLVIMSKKGSQSSSQNISDKSLCMEYIQQPLEMAGGFLWHKRQLCYLSVTFSFPVWML